MFGTQEVHTPECGITLGWHAVVFSSPGEVSASDRTNENKRRERPRRSGKRKKERARASGVHVHSPTPGAVTELAGLF